MLYYINELNKDTIKKVKQKTFADINWLEKDLENLISENILKLIPENQLFILNQEIRGQEAADIFALDKDGNLYIFELKRWKSNQENILQVLRYGQIYGQYLYQELQLMLRKYKNNNQINLDEKHYDYFKEIIATKLEYSQFNRDQNFVVITNGTDRETLNAIKYWEDKGIKIDSIIYRIYEIENKLIFEFNPYNPENENIIEEEEGYYIVNTNITWSKINYLDMLNQEKASAYHDRKNGIANINKGDTVFLYHTGIGIIAYGKALDSYKKADVNGEINEEFYVELKFDWRIDPDTEPERAVQAWEINSELDSGYRFRQTVFSIFEEMAEVIKKISMTK